jgi:hypothetical protein
MHEIMYLRRRQQGLDQNLHPFESGLCPCQFHCLMNSYSESEFRINIDISIPFWGGITDKILEVM